MYGRQVSKMLIFGKDYFTDITVDGSPRSDEAHKEGVRRRLLYIHAKMKIYNNRFK